MEENQRFIHGTLEVTIFDATSYAPSFPFNCLVSKGRSAYVTIKIDDKKVAKTSPERDRIWNQTFQILCAHPLSTRFTITLKTSCTTVGRYEITARQILENASLIDGHFPLVPKNGKSNHPKAKLRFMLWFRPVQQEHCWGSVLKHRGYQGIRNASFPQRSNCQVTLYQDAHHNANFASRVGVSLPIRNLWEDIYQAIDCARHLVYISGWSLNPNLVLVRDPETAIPHARGVTIGELLKRKAEEGVAVRIMVWDDQTSLPWIKNKGVMGTDDETALACFRHTKVVCRLCPRSNNKLPTAFTHHQKTITVDARVTGGSVTHEREILSFLGGFDIFNGRYDTEEHSLFRTLNDDDSNASDFYQTSIGGASLRKGGPRQPWHDTHASVVGEAAWDILRNFEQRWTKQCDPSLLLNTSSVPNLVHAQTSLPRDWNVQVFRSIDHLSATQLPKSHLVERSVHEAYIESIRNAERFIYIENQYFSGSSFNWEIDNDSGCTNLIPIEIALKIASKIRSNERFAAYIVIPMWPEGEPESEAVQDMLHWTRQTMSMMYKIIGEAIRESGQIGKNPKDYLNFFCLANREEKKEGEFVPPSPPHPQTHYWNSQNNRRFMIYVHSKLIIVDDVYMLIGSANINQRSMDGTRDTEIAIGCYQTDDSSSSPIGRKDAIEAFRKSLWLEHTGAWRHQRSTKAADADGDDDEEDDSFGDPGSLECVRRMQEIGDRMWRVYCGADGDEVADMGGIHLVSYPVAVTGGGVVEDLPGGVETDGDGRVCFPDTEAPVMGRRAKMLPPALTT